MVSGRYPVKMARFVVSGLSWTAMRIEFSRTGGIAGLRTLVRLDSDALADDERSEVERLVQQADFFALAAEYRSPRPDAFRYAITIEAPGQAHRVAADEMAMPDRLRPLVAKLKSYARSSG